MPKYLMIWEGDLSRQPVDYKERGQGYKQALAMVKQDLESGILKEWGIINSELKGYWIAEGTEIEVGLMAQKYVPFFSFKTYPIMTYDQAIEFVDKMLK